MESKNFYVKRMPKYLAIAVIVFVAGSLVWHYGRTVTRSTPSPQPVVTQTVADEEYDTTRQPFIYRLAIEKIEKPIQYSDFKLNWDNGLFEYGDGFVREDNSDAVRFVYSKHLKDDISLLPPQGSHEYNGYPIDFAHEDEKLEYIGLKINDRELIGDLKVEMAFDGRDGFGSAGSPRIAFIQKACACGPGIFLTPIGDSSLEFIAQSGEVSWFALKKPIPFKQGSRMQIFFRPTGKSGDVNIQLQSLVLEVEHVATYREVVFNTAQNYAYRASFVNESIGFINLKPRGRAIDIEIHNGGKDVVIFDPSTLDNLFERIVSGGLKQINIKSADGTVRSSYTREQLTRAVHDRIINPGESYTIYNFSDIDPSNIAYADYDDAGLPPKPYRENLEVIGSKRRIYNWNLASSYSAFGKKRILYVMTADAKGNALLDGVFTSHQSVPCGNSRCYWANYLLPVSENFWKAIGLKKDSFIVVKDIDGPAATLENTHDATVRAGNTRDTIENYIKKTGGTIFDETTNSSSEKTVLYRYGDTIGYAKRIGDKTAVFEVNREILNDPKILEFIKWFVTV